MKPFELIAPAIAAFIVFACIWLVGYLFILFPECMAFLGSIAMVLTPVFLIVKSIPKFK